MVLLLSVTALPMLLNCSKKIRSTPLLRFLSFFLLPLILSVLMLGDGIARFYYMMSTEFLTFFICLTVAYIRFSRKQNKLKI